MSKKPRRAINDGPKSEVGQARQELYKKTMARIENAMSDGYALEAVALLESVIADRLESRLAFIHENAENKRTYSTIGRLHGQLTTQEPIEPPDAIELYNAIKSWADDRNKALHRFAKHAENCDLTWDQKYENASATAELGRKLFRDLDNMIRRLNRQQKR